MDKNEKSLLPLKEAARFLGVSRSSLLRLEGERRIAPYRTAGGHRRYDPDQLTHLREDLRRRHAASAETPPPSEEGTGTLISRIGAQLLVERDTDAMLRHAARALKEVTGATVTAYFGVGAEELLLSCHSGANRGEALRPYLLPILPDVLRATLPVYIADVRNDKRFSPHHGVDGQPRSLAVVAIIRRGMDSSEGSDVCGVLAASHESPDFFSPVEIDRLAALAIQVGVALENVRMYRLMSRRNRMLTVLNHVAATLVAEPDREKALRQVLSVCLQVTGASFGALRFLARDGEDLRLIEGGRKDWWTELEALPGVGALREGQPVRIDDLRLLPGGDRPSPMAVRSFLSVPLRSETGGFTGGIYLAHPHAGCFDETHLDITRGLAAQAIVAIERMIAAEENAETRRELESIFHGIADPLTVIDGDLRVVDCNEGLLERLGKSREEVVGRGYFEVLVGNVREEAWNVAPLVFNTGEAQAARVPMVNAEGASLLMDVTAYPVRDARGNVVKVVEYAKEVTAEVRLQLALLDRNEELKAATESMARQAEELDVLNRQLQEKCLELEWIAVTDVMTGLPNHRAFQQCLMEEMRRAQKESYPLSLLILDVDHFKSYNDTFGHPAGDDVLRDVGQVLMATLRPSDTAARYGGEEFSIVLPRTGKEEATLMAERIRAAIAAHPFQKRAVTASIGVAGYPEDAGDKDRLIYMADQALYAAKQSGRNAICTWPVPLIIPTAA